MLKKSATAYTDSIPETSNNHLVSVGDRLMKYFRDDAEKTMRANHEKFLKEKHEQSHKANR